jgi:RimJ/RimL family protein N-acetyltransferase
MITGKLATAEDFEAYYFLRCDQNNIKWTGYNTTPEKERIHNWYLENIAKPGRYFFLFFEDDNRSQAAGYLYMDVVGEKNDTIDTGHGVHSWHGGKGYGTEIIRFALDFARTELPFIKHFQGWIASDNQGSIKNVLKNGYYKTPETKEVEFASGEKKVYEKYMIDLY